MDPSYLLSVFLADVSSLMVLGDIFFAHLGPFSTNWHSLKAIAYLSIVDEYAHPFMTNAYPSSDYFFQLDKASCHRTPSPVGDLYHRCAANKSAPAT